MNPKRIYIIAGEASGDAHGAVLMKEIAALVSDVQFFGAGGPEMRLIAGNHFMDWTQEAVVGLWDVLVKYPYFREKFYRMYREIRQLEPDTVIFVDYPGFNLRLAHYLRRKQYAGKLIYYISPQVWAWNRSRIPRMAGFLDLMICIFPFEKSLYEASGLRTEFVGHPMVEELEPHRIYEPRNPKLIALLPGSRNREIRRIFPVMLDAAKLLRRKDATIQVEASAASERGRELMRKLSYQSGLSDVPIGLKNAYEVMQRAFVGMVASGTATLESSFFQLPFVLIYKVSWLSYIPGRMLIRVNHLGMPNILAGKEIIPEFIQHKAVADRIADAVRQLCNDPMQRDAMIREMGRVIKLLGEKGAARRAAEAVARELELIARE
ncbi:MAG: lipid-A-disaccharide synthase [Verrucomicrobia bacterium]|nr:lipid-A-disaccharide synthase [Verrucomicrobiota bacterium]